MMMRKGAHDIYIGVTVRDHHTFGPGGRTARVIDREEVSFINLDFGKVGRMCRQSILVIYPVLTHSLQRHEVLDTRQFVSNAINSFEII